MKRFRAGHFNLKIKIISYMYEIMMYELSCMSALSYTKKY